MLTTISDILLSIIVRHNMSVSACLGAAHLMRYQLSTRTINGHWTRFLQHMDEDRYLSLRQRRTLPVTNLSAVGPSYEIDFILALLLHFWPSKLQKNCSRGHCTPGSSSFQGDISFGSKLKYLPLRCHHWGCTRIAASKSLTTADYPNLKVAWLFTTLPPFRHLYFATSLFVHRDEIQI